MRFRITNPKGICGRWWTLRSIGRVRNERNGALLAALRVGLLFTDLLRLDHSLHDELVLALLIDVALNLALPWEVQLGLPALVERKPRRKPCRKTLKHTAANHHTTPILPQKLPRKRTQKYLENGPKNTQRSPPYHANLDFPSLTYTLDPWPTPE